MVRWGWLANLLGVGRQMNGFGVAALDAAGAPAASADEDDAARQTRLDADRTEHQNFVLQVVQPGLAGLMDGSVSTLAPLFATAFATQSSHTAFLVGVAAAVGAGISMGFAEGLSDDGTITGRGSPVKRGIVTALATFVGGILHTLPFLIPDLHTGLYAAYAVVGLELLVIAYIRFHYFNMSFVKSAIQVIFGGALVFAAGVFIGSS